MKTIYINGSPKRKFSVSDYLAGVINFFTGGKSVKAKLCRKADGEKILPLIETGDNVVFTLPLYVDGIPSHMLYFLKDMEKYCRDNSLDINVYAVCNNGFIEGRQAEPAMRVLENFCSRSNIKWRGGMGIGGGVMLNVMRIMWVVYLALFVVNVLVEGIRDGNWFAVGTVKDFLDETLTVLVFNLGVFFYGIQMGAAIRKGKDFGKKYTRILLPSIVFIVAADIFFTVISLFEGGLFRGWFSKKPLPDDLTEI